MGKRKKPRRTKQRWTKEEDDYVKEKWGFADKAWIARRLGRSVSAVTHRAHDLGLGAARHRSDMIVWREFAMALYGEQKGAKSTAIRQRLESKGFPLHKVRASSKYNYWMVNIDEFWEFAENHKELFDFAKFEENMMGDEPDWAKEKRRQDCAVANKRARSCKRWTPADDTRLRWMLGKFCYTYSEIADELGRSVFSIRMRIDVLEIKDRPVPEESKRWRKKDIYRLMELREEGLSWDEIAARMGRPVQTIYYKHMSVRQHGMKEGDKNGISENK